MLKKMVVKLVVVALALILGSSSARAFTMIEYSLRVNIYDFALRDTVTETVIRPKGVDGITQNISGVGVWPVGEETDIETNPNPEDYQEEARIYTDEPLYLESRSGPSWNQDTELESLSISLICESDYIEEALETAAVAQIAGLTFEIPGLGGVYELVVDGDIEITHHLQREDDTRFAAIGSLFSLSGLGLTEDINLLEYINTPGPEENDFYDNVGWDIATLIPDELQTITLPGGTYQVDLTFAGASTMAPIPGALWLLGTGLVGLGLLGRRQKRG
jgi:hypothetical protein